MWPLVLFGSTTASSDRHSTKTATTAWMPQAVDDVAAAFLQKPSLESVNPHSEWSWYDDNISFLENPAPADSSCYCACPSEASDSTVRWILRHTKHYSRRILVRLWRMQYAAPLATLAGVFLVALCLGVLIGYWLGRRKTHKGRTSISSFSIPESIQAVCCYILGAILPNNQLYTLQNKQQTEQERTGLALQATTDELDDTVDDDSYRTDEMILNCQLKLEKSIMDQQAEETRVSLKSLDKDSMRESGVPLDYLPRHIAVIMDGNRRYGKERYDGNATAGHWDGSRKVIEFAKWCIAERIQILTIYAFSTENWNREPQEVASLMALFARYCAELEREALQRNIRVQILSTETAQIPAYVKRGLRRLQDATRKCRGGLIMNICLSYGSRGEILHACKSLAQDVATGTLELGSITESVFQSRLLTGKSLPDPDIVIRTSGEFRISNFLLWQIAYSELFFLEKKWPELEKGDLIKVIQDYTKGRQRRFGK